MRAPGYFDPLGFSKDASPETMKKCVLPPRARADGLLLLLPLRMSSLHSSPFQTLLSVADVCHLRRHPKPPVHQLLFHNGQWQHGKSVRRHAVSMVHDWNGSS